MRLGLIDNQIEPVNDNSDPNVLYEGALNRKVFDFDHLRKLQAAGVETFILTSWSPPDWMKTNMSMNYQGGNAEGSSDTATNRLDFYQYDEFAESMVAVVRMFGEEGVGLAAIGLQNEPAFDEPYPSAILDPHRFVELIKIVGRRFQKDGIHTRLFMPEQVFSQKDSMDAYIAALNADPEAEKYCDIVATHGYDESGTRGQSMGFPAWQDMWKRAQSGAVPKDLWMTETGFGYRDWASALNTGVTVYGGLEAGNMGLSTTWSIEGQLVDRGKPNPTFYVCSQFFRHIRPGARRVSSECTAPGVLATSYVNDAAHGGALVSVLINTADSAQAVKLAVNGRPAPARLSLTRTDRVNRHADVSAPPSGGLILLPPKSVTTVVGE
jgi:O-glycosyl hydrolase